MPASNRKLLASIHDVSPVSLDAVDRLADLLAAHLGGPRFALLVVPDHWGRADISHDRAFHARLRDWHAAGAEIFVHGWYHRDDGGHATSAARWKATVMTASEGEFLGLDRQEAARRMIAGKTLIEDIIGDPVAGFIAPAWLYGPGAMLALNDAGFALAEDHLRVWSPATGETIARGPVITWASRSPGRIRSSLAFARLARFSLQPLPNVRLAVHPGDVTVPALLESIDATLRSFAWHRQPAAYRDLLKRLP